MNPKGYDTTIARIAGNLLSGVLGPDREFAEDAELTRQDIRRVHWAVDMARAIIADVTCTEASLDD